MKKIQILLFFIFFTFLFSKNGNAQDDSICGFVIDGVLVDSIPCWNFSKMQVVFPLKDSWKEFDKIQLSIINATYDIPQDKFANYFFNSKNGKASLGAITVFYVTDDGKKQRTFANLSNYNSGFADEWLKLKGRTLKLCITGYKITGTKEVDQGNGVYVKKPIYDNGTTLYTSKEVPYAYLKTYKDDVQGMTRKSEKELEILNTKTPCICPGKPFTQKLDPIENSTIIYFIK